MKLSSVTRGLITKALKQVNLEMRYRAIRHALEREMPKEQAKHAARKMMLADHNEFITNGTM